MHNQGSSNSQDRSGRHMWRWIPRRFSMRGLLLLLTVITVMTGWLNHHYRLHQQEQIFLHQLTTVLRLVPELKDSTNSPDGTPVGLSELLVVAYDYQYDNNGSFDASATPGYPKWLRAFFGEHFFHRVHSVSVNSWDDSDQVDYDEFYRSIDESALQGISGLSELKHLSVFSANGSKLLDPIASLKNLESLETNLPIRLDAINRLSRLQKLNLKHGEIVVQTAGPLACKLRSLKVFRSNKIEDLLWCGDLDELSQLELDQCPKLKSLACTSDLSSLEVVKILGCPLQDLQPLSNASVKSLTLSSCEGVNRLFKPRDAESTQHAIEGNHNSTVVDVSFPSLEKFELRGPVSPSESSSKQATGLNPLSKSLNLKSACFSGLGFKDIRELTSLKNLEHVEFESCRLRESLELPMLHLRSLNLNGCTGLESLSGVLPCLKTFEIRNCRSLKEIKLVSAGRSVEQVVIENPSSELAEVNCLSCAKKLKAFRLVGSGLTNLSFLADADELETLDIEKSKQLTELHVLERKNRLKTLRLHGLPGLSSLALSNLDSLQEGTLKYLQELNSLELLKLKSLKRLELDHNPKLTRILLSDLKSLQELALAGLLKLNTLELQGLDSLEKLSLDRVPEISALPLSGLPSLQTVSIRFVKQLQVSEEMNELIKLRELSIDESCLTPEEVQLLRNTKTVDLQVFRGVFLIVDPN